MDTQFIYITFTRTTAVPQLKFKAPNPKPKYATNKSERSICCVCTLHSSKNILSTLGISLGAVRVSKKGGKGRGSEGRSCPVQGHLGCHVNLLTLRATIQSHTNTHIQYPQGTTDSDL